MQKSRFSSFFPKLIELHKTTVQHSLKLGYTGSNRKSRFFLTRTTNYGSVILKAMNDWLTQKIIQGEMWIVNKAGPPKSSYIWSEIEETSNLFWVFLLLGFTLNLVQESKGDMCLWLGWINFEFNIETNLKILESENLFEVAVSICFPTGKHSLLLPDWKFQFLWVQLHNAASTLEPVL